jgi:O-antigen/teichoic acid export membrane protein
LALAKAVSVATAFVSVPLLLAYLGVERYGLWMTVSSLALLLGFVDLGIGNGLLNGISEVYATNDGKLAREYISSAFFSIASVSVVLIAALAIVGRLVPWARIFNVSSPLAISEAGQAATVYLTCLFLTGPVGVVQRIQAGYQRGFDNSLWQATGTLLGLGGLLLALRLRLGLPALVFAVVGLPILASVAQGVVLFGWHHRELLPSWSAASAKASRRILHLGILFFGLQLAAAVAFGSDNFVAAQVLGADSVTTYAVTVRLFSLPAVFLGMLLVPLWPAYGEAITRGDMVWVRSTLRRSLLWAVLLTGLPSVAFVVWGVPLIQWWTRGAVTPSRWLLLGTAVSTVLLGLGNAVAMFLNSANIIWFQLVCASLLAVGGLVAKIIFARIWGLGGIAWAGVVAYGAFAAIPYLVMVPRLLAQMTSSRSATVLDE